MVIGIAISSGDFTAYYPIAHGGGGNLTLVVLLQQLCKILVMLLHQHRANVDGGGVGRCVLGAGAGGCAGRVCGAVGGRAGTLRGRT